MSGPVPKSVVVGSSREPLDPAFISFGDASASVISRLVAMRDQDTRLQLDRTA